MSGGRWLPQGRGAVVAYRNSSPGLRVGRDGRNRLVLVLATVQPWHVLMNEQDRRRRRALIAFQIFVYGAMLAMFLIQLQMLMVKDW